MRNSRGAVVARRSYIWSLHQYGNISFCDANVVGSNPTGSIIFFFKFPTPLTLTLLPFSFFFLFLFFLTLWHFDEASLGLTG